MQLTFFCSRHRVAASEARAVVPSTQPVTIAAESLSRSH
jgi:hypothetical protein